jgi:DNA-binding PucR family transcriptional regulator
MFDHAVSVGMGSLQPMAGGFRRTHLEALDANRFARHRRKTLIDYATHSLAILLSSDKERAQWFVESELGELATSSPRHRELLTTLRCYYEAKLRIAITAQRLHIHRNTAIARLNTVEAILGHPISERIAETQSALALLEYLSLPR